MTSERRRLAVAASCRRGPGNAGSGWWLFPRDSDVRWLTNFDGSYGFVLLHTVSGNGVLLTDSRYMERARAIVSSSDAGWEVKAVGGGRNLAEAVRAVVGDETVVVDPGHLTHAQFESLGTLPGGVSPASSELSRLRRSKDDVEIGHIRRAAMITDEALQSVVADGLAGRTEKAIAARLEYEMRILGADSPAFDTIVACGTNASVPHHVAGSDIVSDDDIVIIDAGARVDGYRSDMTRTVTVGSPDSERLRMLEWVTRAQAAGIAAVAVGADCADVDRACRAVFDEQGVGDLFIHGVGHGVGLDIHEEPFLTAAAGTVLLAGEVVTVEPGLYREGLGGVRVEDSVLVTGPGPEILTLTPKDIRCPRSRRMI